MKMKKNKKIFLIVLFLICLFTITGCGGNVPLGKYSYGKSSDEIYGYFDCNANKKCDWYMKIEDTHTSATYKYTIKESSNDKYLLHLKIKHYMMKK